MSKQGRVLMDLIRQLTDAESFGIARSPLVPKTAAEFAGPKADIPETEAEELKAKIEKQEEVQKKQKDAQWETNQVLRPSEKVETCIKTTPTSRSAARLGMEDRSPIARIEEADILAERLLTDTHTIEFLLQLRQSQSPALDFALAMHPLSGGAVNINVNHVAAAFNCSPLRELLKLAGVLEDATWGRKAGLAFFHNRGMNAIHPRSPRLTSHSRGTSASFLRETVARAIVRRTKFRSQDWAHGEGGKNVAISSMGNITSTTTFIPAATGTTECEWPTPAGFMSQDEVRVSDSSVAGPVSSNPTPYAPSPWSLPLLINGHGHGYEYETELLRAQLGPDGWQRGTGVDHEVNEAVVVPWHDPVFGYDIEYGRLGWEQRLNIDCPGPFGGE